MGTAAISVTSAPREAQTFEEEAKDLTVGRKTLVWGFGDPSATIQAILASI